MRKKRELVTIQKLAEHGADAESREVGARLRALRAEEERLRQVTGFAEHYEQFSGSDAAGLTLGALQGRRQFAARLRTAADQQREVVRAEEGRYQGQVDRWRDARARALSLQRYNEHVRKAAREEGERREQSVLDEIALRRR